MAAAAQKQLSFRFCILMNQRTETAYMASMQQQSQVKLCNPPCKACMHTHAADSDAEWHRHLNEASTQVEAVPLPILNRHCQSSSSLLLCGLLLLSSCCCFFLFALQAFLFILHRSRRIHQQRIRPSMTPLSQLPNGIAGRPVSSHTVHKLCATRAWHCPIC